MKNIVKTEDLEVSLTAYARFRSHSTGWVSNQIAAGMPHSGGGRSGKRVSIPLAHAVAWEIENAENVAEAPAAGERARLYHEQADRLALQNAERRGELVRRVDVEAMIRAACAILRAEFDGLPGRLAGQVANLRDVASIRALLFTELRRAQRAYADRLGEAGRDGQPIPGLDSDADCQGHA